MSKFALKLYVIRLQSFQRAVSRNGRIPQLGFSDACVPECQDSWSTYNAVTNEAWKMYYTTHV